MTTDRHLRRIAELEEQLDRLYRRNADTRRSRDDERARADRLADRVRDLEEQLDAYRQHPSPVEVVTMAGDVVDVIPGPRVCRSCGCSDLDACLDQQGRPCSWAEPDRCTACPPDELLLDAELAGEVHGQQRIALASYDGSAFTPSSGTTHLVYLDRFIANTACGDAWSLDRATPHRLPAPLTCDRCRARLDVPRRPIDADQLRRLLAHRDPLATVVVTEPLEETAHG